MFDIENIAKFVLMEKEIEFGIKQCTQTVK